MALKRIRHLSDLLLMSLQAWAHGSLAAFRKLTELQPQEEKHLESVPPPVAVSEQRHRGGIARTLVYLNSERRPPHAGSRLDRNVIALRRALPGDRQ